MNNAFKKQRAMLNYLFKKIDYWMLYWVIYNVYLYFLICCTYWTLLAFHGLVGRKKYTQPHIHTHPYLLLLSVIMAVFPISPPWQFLNWAKKPSVIKTDSHLLAGKWIVWCSPYPMLWEPSIQSVQRKAYNSCYHLPSIPV